MSQILSFPDNWNAVSKDFQFNQIEQAYYLSDGKLIPWTGEMQDIYSPIWVGNTHVRVGSIPQLTEIEAKLMLQAAKNAFGRGLGKWPCMNPIGRINAMRQFVVYMKEQRTLIAKLLMWEICKTQSDAEKEFDRTIEYIEDTILAYMRWLNLPSRNQIRRTPRGVVLCMGPYNYPLNELFTTVIPALISGNVVIIKPARIGVLLFQPLLKCFLECFPQGVVNVIYGDGEKVISPLIKGNIDSLAFIGGDKTADIIMSQHPYPHRLHSVLGLGAKNPAIIMQNADIKNAVKECVLGALSFNGQRCTALKILFVHRSISDEFSTSFASAVNKLTIGLPWQNDTIAPHQTPLPEVGKVAAMKSYVDDAISKGATILNGEPVYHESTMKPVVLFNVTSDAEIYHKEQFGPVVPIVIYDKLEEVIDYMYASEFGQQVSIFTEGNIDKYSDMFQNLVCRINFNVQCARSPDTMPFTGRKSSAKGVLSIEEALNEFTLPYVIYEKP